MHRLIVLAIGIFLGTMFGVVLGSILAADGQSYSGPVDPKLQDRETGALS